MLFAWLTQYSKLKQGEFSQDEYDNWRYNYPNIEPTTDFVRKYTVNYPYYSNFKPPFPAARF